MVQSALQKILDKTPSEAEAANAMAEQLTQEQAECIDGIDGEGAEEEPDEPENAESEGNDDGPVDIES